MVIARPIAWMGAYCLDGILLLGLLFSGLLLSGWNPMGRFLYVDSYR